MLAAEGGHWYFPDGTLCTEVALKKPAKDGRTTTAPTIRHAKELHLYPSVTTIYKIKSEPGLTKYLIDKAIRIGHSLGGNPIEDAIAEWEKYQEAPRDRGTFLHGAIERLINREEENSPEANKAYAAFEDFLIDKGVEQAYVEHGFCNTELGYAGKTDFAAITSGKPIIVDFKFVQKARAALDKEVVQGAAYLAGLNFIGGRFFNLLFHEGTGDLIEAKEWTQEEIEWGYKVFTKAFDLWIAYNEYDPRK